MLRHLRLSHNQTSTATYSDFDIVPNSLSGNASTPASNEPLEVRFPSLASQKAPKKSSPPANDIDAVDAIPRPPSPCISEPASKPQVDHPKHQLSTDMSGVGPAVARILELSLKLQALEEEHRSLLTIDPELLRLDGSTSDSHQEEGAALSDHNTDLPTDQPEGDRTCIHGETSSQSNSFSSGVSGSFPGGIGINRFRDDENNDDDEDEPDSDEEGSKRPKIPRAASPRGSERKMMFQYPMDGCRAKFQYIGNLM